MKKWLLLILPVLLIASSIASFRYMDFRKEEFKAVSLQLPVPMDLEDLMPEETYHRPMALEPIYPKVSLLLLNGIHEKVIEKINHETLIQAQIEKDIVTGVIEMEPIRDIHFNYQALISGLNPLRTDTFLKITSRESDSLLKLVQDYEKAVYIADYLMDLSYDDENWESSHLSILNVDTDSWQYQPGMEDEWTDILLEYIQDLASERLLIITSLEPSSHLPFSWNPRFKYSMPFCVIAEDLDTPNGNIILQVEDLTATIAYALGLPSPTGNTGLPMFYIFSEDSKGEEIIDEEEAENDDTAIEAEHEDEASEEAFVDRLMHFGNNFLINAMHSLSNFGLDESIAMGHFIYYAGKLDFAKNQGSREIQRTIVESKEAYQEYIDNVNEQNHTLPVIIAVALLALILIIWLLFLPFQYKGFLFGIAWLAIWLTLFHVVFQLQIELPALQEFSWNWIMTAYLWPLVISTIVVGALMTLMGGFVFNDPLSITIKDMQAATGTFWVFLVAQSAFFTITHGIVIFRTMPGFFSQALLYRNLSHITMLPLALVCMILIALGIYGLTLILARKK